DAPGTDDPDDPEADAAASGAAANDGRVRALGLDDPDPEEQDGGSGAGAAPAAGDDDGGDEADGGGRGLSARRNAIRRGGRAPSSERLYVVTYDIADQRRWRRVFRTMKGFGRWLQLSVFQCRLSGRRRAELGAALERLVNQADDHVIILDLGL